MFLFLISVCVLMWLWTLQLWAERFKFTQKHMYRILYWLWLVGKLELRPLNCNRSQPGPHQLVLMVVGGQVATTGRLLNYNPSQPGPHQLQLAHAHLCAGQLWLTWAWGSFAYWDSTTGCMHKGVQGHLYYPEVTPTVRMLHALLFLCLSVALLSRWIASTKYSIHSQS